MGTVTASEYRIFATEHHLFIRRCFEFAARGRGKVGSGALVGAVLVRKGRIIAEGWYEKYGALHAERVLLQRFDQKINSSDSLYISLEPCCHQGKTPPCTDFVIERGIKRVIYGMVDPDSRVSGKGIDQLRNAGIEVIGPILPEECARLNRGFVSLMTLGRPWITLKMAKTRDGRVMNPDDSPLKITSYEQDVWSHTFLRSRHDAILVGVGTILRDNPQLNNRLDQYSEDIYRIILDQNLRTYIKSRVVNSYLANRTIVVCSLDSAQREREKFKILSDREVKILPVPICNGQFEWDSLWQGLASPSNNFYGLSSILVEGGKKTWDTFRKARMFDEEVILIGN